MTDSSKGKKERANARLQGDGRPFSLAEVKPSAAVSKKKLVLLVEPLGLPLEKHWKLIAGIERILQGYLGEVLTAQRKADYAASRHALKRIAIESASIAKHLNNLDNKFLVEIEKNRGDPVYAFGRPEFDFLHLVPTLERLSMAAERAGETFPARGKGAPTKTLLDNVMRQFRDLFDKVGVAVELRESGSKVNRRSIGKEGGVLLVAIFKEFQPLVDETVIWGAWKRSEGDNKQET